MDAALKKAGIKLAAADLKQILKAVSWRVETAPPVIAKVHKPGKAKADPLRGLFEATVDGKPAVVEYEPDSDLRDTEQVPLLEEGGIEAFIRREVLPYTPDAWIKAGRHQDRLRGQLHAALLQAAAAAHAGGDQRRHPRHREGGRGAAGWLAEGRCARMTESARRRPSWCGHAKGAAVDHARRFRRGGRASFRRHALRAYAGRQYGVDRPLLAGSANTCSHKIEADGWGEGIVVQLADYIARREPGKRGFSAQNLWRMRQFFEA